MPPSLGVCLFLLTCTACLARPNWHKGLSKNDKPMDIEAEAKHQNPESLESSNINDEDKALRSSRHLQMHSGQSTNLQFQFGNQGFRFPGFQSPGLYPIQQLAGTLDSIINSHLDTTVQRNKQIHFGLDGFQHPPAIPQFCPHPPCTTHTEFHQTSHIQFGRPQIVPIGTHTNQFECLGSANCRGMPMQNNPVTKRPYPVQDGKFEPITKPSTTTERQDFGNQDSDIGFDGDEKGAKEDDENPGIDIRFGN